MATVRLAIKIRPTSAAVYLISLTVSPSMQPGRASTSSSSVQVRRVMIYTAVHRADYSVNKLWVDVKDRWSTSNTTGTQPRAGANDMGKYFTSSAEVHNGSYFKIKQIQLGYTLPKSLLKKVFINNMRIYASLEDFFTFTSYDGFDPEVTGVGNSLGVDKGSYPTSKKAVVGVSVTF